MYSIESVKPKLKYRTSSIITCFAVISFALPKAGAILGTVPVTVAEILFIICCIISIKFKRPMKTDTRFTIIYIVFAFFMIFSGFYNIANGVGSAGLTMFILVLLSPFSYYFLALNEEDIYKYCRIVCFSVSVVGLYALIQWIFGIEATKIPGVTIALGESYSRKPIGWGANGLEALKMPTTYQNGNISGVNCLMFMLIILQWKPTNTRDNQLRFVGFILVIVTVALSGSRSVLFPLVLFLLYTAAKWMLNLIRYHKLKKKALALGPVLMLFITIIALIFNEHIGRYIGYFVYRFVESTLRDPTAAGRTTGLQYAIASFFSLSGFEKLRFLIVGAGWRSGITIEGIFNMFFRYGLPALFSTFALLAYTFNHEKNRQWSLSVLQLCIILALAVDGTMFYNPTLMNYFFILKLSKCISFQKTKSKVAICNLSTISTNYDIPVLNKLSNKGSGVIF